jgi:hypothetical protein
MADPVDFPYRMEAVIPSRLRKLANPVIAQGGPSGRHGGELAMFFHDPTLYGATLPYKDFPIQQFGIQPPMIPPTPFLPLNFTPWQNRFVVPPTFGFPPQYQYNVPPHQYNVPPFPFPQFFDPRYNFQQFGAAPFVPPTPNPFFQNLYGMNLPTQPWARPVC